MIEKNKKLVLVSDFDGTISKNDFFKYSAQYLLADEDLSAWLEYKAGKISHVEGLRQIYSKIRLSKNEFNDFIDTIKIEEFFAPTVEICKEKNIDFYIISAGADYYINRILNNLNLTEKVKIITNPSEYSETTGLVIKHLDNKIDHYDTNLGISKKYFIKKLKNEGFFVIFAGDGYTDIEAAKHADLVFAKDYLTTLCQKENIKYSNFSTYEEIYNFISNN